jgi:hypothetical protein
MKGLEVGDCIHSHKIISEARKASDPAVHGQERQAGMRNTHTNTSNTSIERFGPSSCGSVLSFL